MEKTGIDGKSLQKTKLAQGVNGETTSPSAGWLYGCGREQKSKRNEPKRSLDALVVPQENIITRSQLFLKLKVRIKSEKDVQQQLETWNLNF